MRGWLAPVLIACVLHAVVIAVLLMQWESSVEFKPVIIPQHIQAKVVELKPKLKPKLETKKKPEKKLVKPRKAPVKKPPVNKSIKKADQKKVKPEKIPSKPVRVIKTPPKEPVQKVDEKPAKPKVTQEQLKAQRQKQLELEQARALAIAAAKEENERKLARQQEQVRSYSAQIRSDIESKWSRPPSARNGMEVILMIQLVPSGELIDVMVLKRSGNDAFDTSAVNAVRKVQLFSVPQEYELFDQNFRKMTLPFKAEGLTR